MGHRPYNIICEGQCHTLFVGLDWDEKDLSERVQGLARVIDTCQRVDYRAKRT